MVSDKPTQHLLDARGLFCPEPVMLLHNKVREIQVGEEIRVLATDPSTRRDIPKFCQFLGHVLCESGEEVEKGVYVYVLVKSAAPDTQKK